MFTEGQATRTKACTESDLDDIVKEDDANAFEIKSHKYEEL